MFFKKNIKKIIFLTVISTLFIIFALSNQNYIEIKLFGLKDKFMVWELVLYSMVLSFITTTLFFIPPIIGLKSKYKALNEKFEILSESKLNELIKQEDEIIE